MLYLTESDVLALLPISDCLTLMRTAFQRLASGEALNQPRRRLTLATKSTLHYMAGSDGQYFGAKVYSTNPGHKPHFLFLLYRAADAELLAIIEANHLKDVKHLKVGDVLTIPKVDSPKKSDKDGKGKDAKTKSGKPDHAVNTYAANRDPAIYDDPVRFDITRDDPPPILTFGGGVHYCLGANLARLEIRLLLDEILGRFGDLEQAGPAEWNRSNRHTGLRRLPLRGGRTHR